MGDVYQWRRRIQPGFSHALMPVGEQDEIESEITRRFGSSRKKVRPKISSYFSNRAPSTTSHGRSSLWSADQRNSFKETISPPYQTWPEACEPDPDQIMDSMMRTLMAEPYRPLDVKHNAPLLTIFEGFRDLRDENASLLRKLKYEVETRLAVNTETELERQRWQQEREDYQAEVKRLELIISQDKEGVASVMRARQGSLLRREHRRRTTSGANKSKDDPRETVLEFLERTRVEDERRDEAARKAQRVPLRNRPVSPSQKMAVLSHKFSSTSHYNQLPFDSPPSPQEFTSLSQASMFEMLAGRPSLSDTDSSENDFAQEQCTEPVSNEDTRTITAANTLFQRESIIEDGQNCNVTQPNFDASLFKENNNQRLTPRASRARPETLRFDHARKFSFEYDDDGVNLAQHKPQRTNRSPLQRSVTAEDLVGTSTTSPPVRKTVNMLASDSAVSSPVMTPMLDSPGLSKIPSPVFDPSLARPRREDSTSSFLTAIRAPDSDAKRSRATSSSSLPLDSPRQSSKNSFRGSGDFSSSQRHSGRHSSMHDVSMAVAAARAAIPADSPNAAAELRGSHHANA